MSTIPTTTATTTQQTLTSASTKSSTSKVIGADFNMFLKLLTTQMQNQDPLNPTDSTEYTQQLAQYSQVEQTVQQSETLKDILASLTTKDLTQASSFIGKDASFASAVSGLGAQPAGWTYSSSSAMTTGTATITNAAGKVVFTRTLEAPGASGSMAWDGKLDDGTKAPDGAYTLAIKGVDAAGQTIVPTINSTGVVNDVSINNGVVSIGVNGVKMSVDTLIRLASAAG